jgi:hypothetical protein
LYPLLQIYEGIMNQELVAKVVSKTRTLPLNVAGILRESRDYGRQVLNKVTQLRCTALLCFQNMVAGLSISDLGGVGRLKETWGNIASALVSQQSTSCHHIP